MSRIPDLSAGPRHEMPFEGSSGAVFSSDRRYRFALWRTWDTGNGTVAFIGLNPSAADEHANDPTIRRCIGFARSWGYRGLLVGNLFALCATRPEQLKAGGNPVGTGNDLWLERLAQASVRLLVCWGTHGAFMDRDRAFCANREDLYCLRRNRDGSPAHPLYIRKDQRPRRWRHDGTGGKRRPAVSPPGPAA